MGLVGMLLPLVKIYRGILRGRPVTYKINPKPKTLNPRLNSSIPGVSEDVVEFRV